MRIYQKPDRYYWQRLEQARALGVDPSELEDEPDYSESDMDWDKWEDGA